MKNVIEILFLFAAVFYLTVAGTEKIISIVEKKKTIPSLSFGIEKKKRFFFF